MNDRLIDSRVRVDLAAVVVAMQAGEPAVLTVKTADGPRVGLPSGPFQSRHPTLQGGLRLWVEEQTGCALGYVEQLYTFADHAPFQADDVANDANGHAMEHKTVSIAYLALGAPAHDTLPAGAEWRSWHAFFPWEDRRRGPPPSLEPLIAALTAWAGASAVRKERIRHAFGLDGAAWDEERALERYELLYAAALTPEGAFDRGRQPSAEVRALPGQAMAADHRRILATAISRLRAKIKYRPVLFELTAPTFTLTELQRTAEAISGAAMHKQNFRRLVANRGLVEETGEIATDTGGRPAKLMRFRQEITDERPRPGAGAGTPRRASYP